MGTRKRVRGLVGRSCRTPDILVWVPILHQQSEYLRGDLRKRKISIFTAGQGKREIDDIPDMIIEVARELFNEGD